MSTKEIKTSLQFINIFFWAFLALVVALRYFFSQPNYLDGDRIRLSQKVRAEPVKYGDAQSLRLSNLQIYLPLFPEINYGDSVVIEGRIEDGELKEAKLLKREEVAGFLYLLRRRIIAFYHRNLPEPHSSLVAGVALGSKGNLPEDFWRALRQTGTAHVVVASGMNVTLVGGFLANFLVNIISRPKAVIFSIIGIWFILL